MGLSLPAAGVEGILLVDKPKGVSSFSLVSKLRKLLNVKKIGHAGTLDPLASGVMVMLIGRNYTRKSDEFLCSDKEYVAQLKFGETTDTYDAEGEITSSSDSIPTLEQIHKALEEFQGTIQQTPPMYSAKKIGGQKLYDLARAGKEVYREPVWVTVDVQILTYHAPYLIIRVVASKGTYIRSIAHDLGQALECGAHLTELQRTRSGHFKLSECIDGSFEGYSRDRILKYLRG